MKDIKIFEKEEFGKVRMIEVNNEPMFCLSDVCSAIGLQNPSTVKDRLENEDVQLIDLHALNCTEGTIIGNSKANFITEGGLYDVLLQSSSPNVKPFRKWVTKEVLPTIRKTGGYVSESTTFVESYFSDLDENAKQFLVQTLDSKKKLLEENKAKQMRIEEMKPKEDFFDAVTDSKDACDMGTVAKVLNCGIGRNKLFELLREEGVLMNNNRPYQKYIDSSYFRVIEQRFMKNGEECINFKTIVYQSGISFIRKILKRRNIC